MRDFFRGVAAMFGFSFRADPRRSFLLIVIAPLSTVVFSLSPYLLGRATDAILRGDRSEAYLVIGIISAASAVGMGMAITSFLQRQTLAEKVDLVIDQRLIELSAAVPTIEHHERPEFLDRLEMLRTHRHELGHVIHGVVQNLVNLVQLSITAGLLLVVHPALTLLPLAALPSMWINVHTQRHYLKVEDETAEDSRRALHYFDVGTTSAPGKELRVFGLGEEWKRRYHRLWSSVEQRRTAARRRSAILGSFGWSFFAVGYGAGMWLVVREAAAGRASVGQVLMAMMLMGRLNGQVSSVAGVVNWLLNSLKTVHRYLWLADYSAERTRPLSDPAPVPNRLTDGIRFEQVAFRYPDTDRDVLHGVDLHLPAGSTIALVGENGAGKTTLIKLLCGFYSPTSGRITVDGTPMDRFPAEEWRQRMSAGFQDFARFEVRAGHVVGIGHMGDLDDDDAVWQALERGGGADVPSKLPEGLATELGSSFGGHDLSGGQWQKLALGRAMMRRRPLLLVLDEPTANLDAETEHGLFQRYAEAAHAAATESGGITVLVSHRFSTVRMADLIVVVDGGKVTEVGTHQQLMDEPALYAELYELQAQAYR